MDEKSGHGILDRRSVWKEAEGVTGRYGETSYREKRDAWPR
jgi:hypothetical protein